MSTINAALVSDIISSKVMEAFTAELAPLKAFSTDFSPEAAAKGANVVVPITSNITASDTENAYETEDSGTLGAVTVALNGYAKATVAITDAQAANSTAAKLENFANQQAAAVAQKIITDAWALIKNANYSAFKTKAFASFTTKEVREMRVTMRKAHVPRTDLSLILDSDYYDKLLPDGAGSVMSALVYGGTEAIREGIVPNILGFATHESQIIPDNGENLKGFAVHPSAMAIAIRPLVPQAPGEYLETRVLTDTDTGISLGYRRHYNPGSGKHYCTFEAVYGAGVGNAAGLVRLKSA